MDFVILDIFPPPLSSNNNSHDGILGVTKKKETHKKRKIPVTVRLFF